MNSTSQTAATTSDNIGGYEFAEVYNDQRRCIVYNQTSMEFLKSITGRLVTGFVALAVVAGGISWWQMDPATRQMLLDGSGRIFAWLGIVLFLPWVSFFVIGKVAKLDSNIAGASLIAAYTIIETFLLAWLFHWHLPGATAWTFLIVGGLFAAAYNLFTCDWIAEKVA